MIKVTFIARDGKKYIVEGNDGDTLLDLVKNNNIDEIEGACEGCLACSTCHIVVDESWYNKLSPASDDEKDMLDMAFGLTATSSLGCQIVLNQELDGLIVWIPADVNNLLLT